jgi:hypothetical protein
VEHLFDGDRVAPTRKTKNFKPRTEECPICGKAVVQKIFKPSRGYDEWICAECQRENWYRQSKNKPRLEIGELIPKLPSGAPMPKALGTPELLAAVVAAMDDNETARLALEDAETAERIAAELLAECAHATEYARADYSAACSHYRDLRAALTITQQEGER